VAYDDVSVVAFRNVMLPIAQVEPVLFVLSMRESRAG
jgi:hypothetical protein